MSVKNTNRIQFVKIQAILKDNWQNYRYFLYIAIQVKENLLCIYTDKQLLKVLPKAHIQATIFYLVKVDSVNASAVLDPSTS